MRKSLFISLLIICFSLPIRAQSVVVGNDHSNAYEYYIRITGVNTKLDVVNLQNQIAKKSGVSFFMANRFPVRYFLLKSDRKITAIEFKSWIVNPSWNIEFYGMGNKGKEQATVLYNKTKTSQ